MAETEFHIRRELAEIKRKKNKNKNFAVPLFVGGCNPWNITSFRMGGDTACTMALKQ
jgi:hypothetical protein